MKKLFFILSGLLFMLSCSDDNNPFIDDDGFEVSPVVFDLNEVPYAKLSDYNFFKSPMNGLEPVYGVLPYQPASQLFVDHAEKKRFIWMPEGTSATYVSDDEPLNFPVGGILIKNLYYENTLPGNKPKLIETRLMIRVSDEWIFANYLWNEDQTEAYFDSEGGTVPVSFIHKGEQYDVNYFIPNEGQCFHCHYQSEKAVPISPKPQSMNFNLNYGNESVNQLQKLKDFGYLSNNLPQNIVSVVDYMDTSQSLDERARAYLDINCAYCHKPEGLADFYPVNLDYRSPADYDALGFCKEPNIYIGGFFPDYIIDYLIHPGNRNGSSIYLRMTSLDPVIMMPYLGKTIVDTEAVELIGEWIDSFEDDCN